MAILKHVSTLIRSRRKRTSYFKNEIQAVRFKVRYKGTSPQSNHFPPILNWGKENIEIKRFFLYLSTKFIFNCKGVTHRIHLT